MWVLGAVAVALALLILPYFQKWLVQRSQIETARAAVSQSRDDVTALAKQRARWDDDNYIRAQARARLNYVMPGETGFVVVDPKPRASTLTTPSPTAAVAAPAHRPWFSDIWLSAQVAADPTGSTSAADPADINVPSGSGSSSGK